MSHTLIDTNHDGSIDINELTVFLGCDEGGGALTVLEGGGYTGCRGRGVRFYRGLGRRSRNHHK